MLINKRPIPDLEHLALAVGLRPAYLRDVAARSIDPYREFQVAKARGSVRTIAAPEPDLAKAQRWILEHMFLGSHAGASSFAYRKGVSVGDCARVHVGARWLVKLDLKDFFHSVDARRVATIFRKVGCDDVTSVLLAKLCTRRKNGSRGTLTGATPLDYLPQGAPTSGMLANLAAENLDRSMSRLASRYRLMYTRYSDDLTFSSNRDFSRASAFALVRSARGEIARNHFSMHEDKIRISPPGSRLVVLGLLVDSERVRMRGDFKKTLNWHVYGCTRFGPDKYSASLGFSSISEYQAHVNGLFAHAIDIEPEWAGALHARWKEITAPR
ncbi:reverse transcriptase family protein [Pseudarthrobacter scleromae]|nr:reverse transcriptase family protein [Pseudarthrobacter scleromae]